MCSPRNKHLVAVILDPSSLMQPPSPIFCLVIHKKLLIPFSKASSPPRISSPVTWMTPVTGPCRPSVPRGLFSPQQLSLPPCTLPLPSPGSSWHDGSRSVIRRGRSLLVWSRSPGGLMPGHPHLRSCESSPSSKGCHPPSPPTWDRGPFSRGCHQDHLLRRGCFSKLLILRWRQTAGVEGPGPA